MSYFGMKAIADVLWQAQFNWSIRIMVGGILIFTCGLHLWLFDSNGWLFWIMIFGLALGISLIIWRLLSKISLNTNDPDKKFIEFIEKSKHGRYVMTISNYKENYLYVDSLKNVPSWIKNLNLVTTDFDHEGYVLYYLMDKPADSEILKQNYIVLKEEYQNPELPDIIDIYSYSRVVNHDINSLELAKACNEMIHDLHTLPKDYE